MEQNKLLKIRDQREKNWFWLDNEYLNGYAKYFGAIGTAIYVSLCRHSNNETQQCFPAIATIASENNIGISTVKKYLKIFQNYKLIDISREKDPHTKRWKNNVYTLLDKSEWIIPTQPIKVKRQKKTSQSHCIAMESQSHPTTEPEPFDTQSQSHRMAHNNTNINNTNNISSKEDRDKPVINQPHQNKSNPDINFLMETLKKANNGILDGSEKTNRQYCWLLLQKLNYKDNPQQATQMVIMSMKAGWQDNFHRTNLTNFRYLYNNFLKIISNYKKLKDSYYKIQTSK